MQIDHYSQQELRKTFNLKECNLRMWIKQQGFSVIKSEDW